ncbi:uncharacterized protein LOC142627831 [Castanea sativa]|uniref:uncharacterized protein LOC142627831 n=1 Tax=Castanea sativa TaxID=21020 RepID=UPI003F65370D
MAAVLECPVPSKFHLPQLEQFDGLKDPLDHLNTFKTTLGLQQPPDEIMCCSFPTTIKRAAKEWFTKLPTSSIDNFEQLSNSFLRHFVRGQRLRRLVDHLLTINQGEKKTLRSYMKHFTRETLEVDEADDKVQLTTFKVGLKSREFVVSLAKNPPKMMAAMLLKAQKYMNAEDALVAIKDEGKTSEKGRKEDYRRGQKRERSDHQTNDEGKRKDEKARLIKFTPLVMPVDKILVQIKDKHYLKWPRPLHSSPNVEELIRKGKLQRFVKKGELSRSKDDDKGNREVSPKDEDHTSQCPPSVIREIKAITSGPSTRGSFKSLKKSYQRQVNNVHRIPPLKQRRTDRNMFFSKEDAKGVKQSHDDHLVIMLTIEGFNIRRILVDNGSFVDIIYLSAFQKLRLDPKRLCLFESPLVSFSRDRVYPKGIVTLTVTVGSYPRQLTREVKGDQVLARECYQAMLVAKENHTWMIEEREEDKVEALETVELVKEETTKMTRIRMALSPEMKTRLVRFLKENMDVFAWSHEDMLGISPKVI